MSPLSKCLGTTETEGKAKLIRKIFSPSKVETKPKDVSSKMENGKEEKEDEVEDEIELQSLGDQGGEGRKNASLNDEKVSRKSDPSDLKTVKKKKPWKCHFCNKRFLSKNILKLHSQKRHPFKTLDGTIFRSGDGEEEKSVVSMVFNTRRIDEEEASMNTSHVVGGLEEVEENVVGGLEEVEDHDDEETDPYEDDSGLCIGFPPEMDKDKAGSQKDVDDGKQREDEDEEMAALQKVKALKILTSRAREDKKKQLRKILKKRRKKIGKEISLKSDSGEEELANIGTRREGENDLAQEEREPISETSPDLNDQAQTLDIKGDEKQDAKPNKTFLKREKAETAVELRELAESEYGEKREEDKLSDTDLKDLVPESENEETEKGDEMGESLPEVVSRCLLTAEGSTVDLPKERGCVTAAETNRTERHSDVEQADGKTADNNKTKICFKTALVASAEPVVASVGTGGGEKESDVESEEVSKECDAEVSEVSKECDRRPEEEIDVVSDQER